MRVCFLQIHLSMCALKIVAAPVEGQAYLCEKTLRREVSLSGTLCFFEQRWPRHRLEAYASIG
jgi:hypothetical protein